jgi:hypothetical protein
MGDARKETPIPHLGVILVLAALVIGLAIALVVR